MSKLIKISDTKAYRISVIQMGENVKGDPKKPKLLSVRQMYCTAKNPGAWLPGHSGITLDFDICSRIIKAMIAVFKSDDKVEIIQPKEKK